MNIQDVDEKCINKLIESCKEDSIIFGYKPYQFPKYEIIHRKPHSEDSRFLLYNFSPKLNRKLVKTWENENYLIGVFYIEEFLNAPYPNSHQYSAYFVDKQDASLDCGGCVFTSGFMYPKLRERTLGLDKKDLNQLQQIINCTENLKRFRSLINKENINNYHSYWKAKENILPNKSEILSTRIENGVMFKLEAILENKNIRVEIETTPEIETSFCQEIKYTYFITIFKDGKFIRYFECPSLVFWPEIKERKFGIDYIDWNNIQKHIDTALDYLEIREKFTIINDEEKFCYFSMNKNRDSLVVMKYKNVKRKLINTKEI